jgi:hypothetical protein
LQNTRAGQSEPVSSQILRPGSGVLKPEELAWCVIAGTARLNNARLNNVL